MNAKWIRSRRSMLVGLLGAAVLFGSPISAQADQGKWWNPERGARGDRGTSGARGDRGTSGVRGDRGTSGVRGDRSVRRSADRQQAYRPPSGVRRPADRQQAYRPPTWRSRGAYQQGPRYSRPWQGRRIYRDRVWLRSDRYYRGQPAYGYRYYWAPSYYYPRHIVYVRPVRFFISVGAVIGGAHIHGSYSDPGDIYGCNFCDAEFSSYHAYEDHVAHCRYAPDGYRVITSDWDQGQWDDEQWQDNRGWDREDDQ